MTRGCGPPCPSFAVHGYYRPGNEWPACTWSAGWPTVSGRAGPMGGKRYAGISGKAARLRRGCCGPPWPARSWFGMRATVGGPLCAGVPALAAPLRRETPCRVAAGVGQTKLKVPWGKGGNEGRFKDINLMFAKVASIPGASHSFGDLCCLIAKSQNKIFKCLALVSLRSFWPMAGEGALFRKSV